jgi:hypothetical protein
MLPQMRRTLPKALVVVSFLLVAMTLTLWCASFRRPGVGHSWTTLYQIDRSDQHLSVERFLGIGASDGRFNLLFEQYSLPTVSRDAAGVQNLRSYFEDVQADKQLVYRIEHQKSWLSQNGFEWHDEPVERAGGASDYREMIVPCWLPAVAFAIPCAAGRGLQIAHFSPFFRRFLHFWRVRFLQT